MPRTQRRRHNERIRGPLVGTLATLRHQWPRRLTWQASPAYWKSRRVILRAVFYVRKSLLRLNRQARSRAEEVSLAWQIIRTVLWATIRAGVFIAAVAQVELTLLAHWDAAARWVSAQSLDRGTYSTFLGSVGAIAGVFIGLYFTTVSLVASSSYREVPADVRALVIAEKVGSVYLSLVAHVGASSILLLAAITVDWRAGFLNFAIMAIVSVISVFSFVSLGARAFAFFDPATLVRSLGRQILDSAQSATSKGSHSRDPSFQAAYQREAERAANTYLSVVRITVASGLRTGDSISVVARHALALLEVYSSQKARIPIESRWFKRVLHHPSWLRASEFEINFALQHGTGLASTERPDYTWLESRLTFAFATALDELSTQNSLDDVVGVGYYAQDIITGLAERFQFDNAIHIHRALWQAAKKVVRAGGNEDPETRLRRLAAVEVLANGPVALAVSLGKAAEALTTEELGQLTRHSIDEPFDAPIGRPVPESVRSTIAFLRRAVAFEGAAEGARVTPTWFAEREVARSYARFLVEVVNTIINETTDTYVPESNALVAENSYAVVLLVQMGLRACARLTHHVTLVADCIARLATFDRPVDEKAWPNLDEQSVANRIARIRDSLLSSLARTAPNLEAEAPTGELPDDFGYAYSVLAQESYIAIMNEAEQLNAVYPAFFNVNLRTFERARKELSGNQVNAQMLIAADVLIDLLEVSGYALVFRELGDAAAWNVLSKRWDQYLNNHRQAAGLLALIVHLYEYRKSAFTGTPREYIRTGWRQQFEHRMNERGYLVDEGHGPFENSTPSTPPTSPVARTFVRLHSIAAASDVFIAFYLASRKEFVGLALPRSVQMFVDECARETERW